MEGKLRGGDALARGAKKATFSTGGARPDEKVQINKGIVGTEKDWAKAEKAKAKDTVPQEEAKLKSKVRPLFDQILVRKTAELDRSKGGIIIPDEAKDRPSEGTVLYVGRGHKQKDGSWWPLEVVPGDLVIFGRYAGTEVKIDGETLLIMNEKAVLAILEENNG
jgi:chaperonin GroES